MNLKRFTAAAPRATPRQELPALVRQAFGDDAVVMSTRPCAEGVEVLAMAPRACSSSSASAPAAEQAPGRAAPGNPPEYRPEVRPERVRRVAPKLARNRQDAEALR
jgi:flagellar biosynthesis protein FlhF